MKKCNHCKIEKDLDRFNKNKRQSDGYYMRTNHYMKAINIHMMQI